MNDGDDDLRFEKIQGDLRSDYKYVRRNCLDKLASKISRQDLKLELAEKLDVLKLVIKTISDEAEACRQRAVNVAMLCIDSWCSPNEDIIFLMLLAIHKRLAVADETEPSEEVRLSCVKLLKSVIHKHGPSVTPCLKEVIESLANSISDQFPDVKKESCECITDLAKTVPEFRLHSDGITNPMLKVLKHKHYKIRVAVINSLCYVVQFGRVGTIELVYGSLGECLLDQHPQVRVAVLKTAAFWLLNLRDRYSYFHHLLPLVLTELSDEILENREEATRLWNEIGVTYVKENEDRLKEKLDFLPVQLEHYPGGVSRPNLGCRTLVQNEMSKIIPTLLKELEDWKIEVRIRSSELLKTITLHAEVNIISFLERLIPTMCKACSDEETTVTKNVIGAAEIIGFFVSPEIYWPLIIPRIKESRTPGFYIILSSLLRNNRKTDVCDKINNIIADLVSNDICETTEELSQNSLLKAVSKILECCGGIKLNTEAVTNLYSISITLLAFTNEEIKENAGGLLKTLSEVAGHSSISDLNKNYLPGLWSRISQSCDMWESYSANFNIFIVLLSQYTGDVLELVPNELLSIFDFVLSSKSDRDMIFKTLFTVAKLFETNVSELQKNIDVMKRIVLGPLKQQLVWRAGKVVEVIRATATSIVLLYLQISTDITSDFVSQMVPLLLSLCEDGYEETRIYSLQTLPHVDKHQNENVTVSDIFPKLLSVASDRLNDKSNEVRLTALRALRDLLLSRPDLQIYRNTSDFECISKALKIILINMDDDNAKIQEASLDIIKEPSIVTKVRSILPEDELNAFIKKCHHQDVSELMRKYLHI